jgi:Pyruvate/2-oxoacid:ferredoxin oxidoreductase delta subunit
MEVIMASASTEKTRAEQLGNHTVSSAASHESTCTRCGGLMVQDFCLDVLGNIGESEFAAKRCVQCGEVVDSVILRNRGTRQEPMTVQRIGKILSNNCVTESLY